MKNNTCRAKGCTAKCGSLHYCAAHRKVNRMKARNRTRSCRAHRFSLVVIPSAPIASEAYYADQGNRPMVEAVGPVFVIPAPVQQEAQS